MSPIVVAMLAWYDERPEDLHRAITSLRCIADTLIAVDGRWDLHPGQSDTSPLDQYQAIEEAAEQAGLDLELHPGQAWTGQVAKRNFMLERALAENADWVMPLDADWELHGNRTQNRRALTHTQADALIVPFHTPINPDISLTQAAATDWHQRLANRTMFEPLIWRALDGIRVEDFHWYYSAIKDGQRVSLWGCHDRYPPAPTERFAGPLKIDHLCFFREQRTIDANREYCAQRDEYVALHGTEPV